MLLYCLALQFHVPEWAPRRSGRIQGLRWYLYDMAACR